MHETLRAEAPLIPGARRLRLGVTIACHSIVDFFAFMIMPLLSVIEGRLDLTPSQGATLIAIQPLIAGAAQPITAWFTDRHDTRMPGVLGMALTVVAISLIGYAETYTQLLVIYGIGCLGIGAFHPVAVACVGELGNHRRSLAVSTFFVAGMIGGATGSYVAPAIVAEWGLKSLAYLILPGLIGAFLLLIAIRPVAHRTHDAHETHAALPQAERRLRWFAVWVLFGGAALRSAVHAATVLLIVRWSEAVVLERAEGNTLTGELEGKASLIAGPMNAALVVGMALGGFTIGSTIRPRFERRTLIIFPMVGAIPIALFPRLDVILPAGAPLQAIAFPVALLMGVAFAGLIPTGVSLAQRTLPHRTSLVSGLMLGGSWAAGAWGPDFAQSITTASGLRAAFDATAGVLALSGILMLLLPRGLGEPPSRLDGR